MNQKKFFELLKKAKNESIVNLENGFRIVTKAWLEKNIEPANLDEESLISKISDYAWNTVDASVVVEYFKLNKDKNVPNFYVLDKDNFIWCDSQNIDMPFCIEEETLTRCYVLTFYEKGIMKIFDVGYMSQKDAEKLFHEHANKHEDVSIYTLKDDTSYDADNIDENAWSKIS